MSVVDWSAWVAAAGFIRRDANVGSIAISVLECRVGISKVFVGGTVPGSINIGGSFGDTSVVSRQGFDPISNSIGSNIVGD